MGQRYSQLTLEERCRLRGLMEMELPTTEIARRLGRHTAARLIGSLRGTVMGAVTARTPRTGGPGRGGSGDRGSSAFIDPPYNTGNEGWAYNDNVNAPMIREWLDANPIGIEDGLRHDKWCAMMWPRLRLLHELLHENGSLCRYVAPLPMCCVRLASALIRTQLPS